MHGVPNPIGSDGVSKIVLGDFLFMPDGTNHGRTAYRAQPRPPPSEPEGWRARLANPVVCIALGVALGVSAAVVIGSARGRAR